MRIGLIGFGRTGRSVASVVLRNPDFSLEWAVRRSERLDHRRAFEVLGEDADAPGLIYAKSAFRADELLATMPVDAIIDFSSEQGIDYYGDAAAERGVAIVSAVSHYSEAKQRQLEELALRTRVLWSPNISVGINFMMLAAMALRKIAPDTDVELLEEHFREKAGVSGTAMRLAESLNLDESQIHSIRAEGIIGVHEMLFGFPAQTVRLRHETISREAFGNGALFAVGRLVAMPKGLYRMEDLLLPYFSHASRVVATPVALRRGWRARLSGSLHSVATRIGGRRDEVPNSPAPSNPLVEVGAFSTNGRGSPVAGPDHHVSLEGPKEPVLN